VRKQVGQPKRT